MSLFPEPGKKQWWIIGLLFCSFGLFLACLGIGPEFRLNPFDPKLWQSYFQGHPGTEALVFFSIRVPRVTLSFLVGGCLSLSGLIFQGLLRNPLADPFIIGVSGGSCLAAVILQILDIHHSSLLILGSFAGGIATLLLLDKLARWGGQFNRFILLLSGVVLNAFFSAIISLLLLTAGDRLPPMMFWLMGSFNLPDNQLILPMGLVALISAGVLYLYAHQLNLLVLGDSRAYHFGSSPEKIKILAMVCASLLTAISVSMAGMIGFIGMFIPHIVRLTCGNDHRIMIPMTTVFGGTLLMIADTAIRTSSIGNSLPVGSLTSLFGAPFFLWLLFRQTRPSIS